MTDSVIDRPDRVFQMWAFTVGMSRLLLRSTKSDSFHTRVDVLFQGVEAMYLPTLLNGLFVAPAGPAVEADIVRQTGLLPAEDTRFFEVESSGRRGFVVASVVAEIEDAGEYFEPSRLWPGPGGIAR